MEYLPNGMTLEVPAGCFPLSTDSMLLAHFAGNIGKKHMLDLCSGCGTIGLMLCAQNPLCRVTGVELDEAAQEGAVQNIQRNHLSSRMENICADVRHISGLFDAGSFDCCVSNPPYYAAGPAAKNTIARREDECSLSELMAAAGWALKFGGDFYLVHRAERLAEIIRLGGEHKLEAKRLALVRHREGSPVTLVLLQLRKGAKPGLKLEDWVLHTEAGKPTPLYREIYHLQEE